MRRLGSPMYKGFLISEVPFRGSPQEGFDCFRGCIGVLLFAGTLSPTPTVLKFLWSKVLGGARFCSSRTSSGFFNSITQLIVALLSRKLCIHHVHCVVVPVAFCSQLQLLLGCAVLCFCVITTQEMPSL